MNRRGRSKFVRLAGYVVAVLLLLGTGGGVLAYLVLTKPGPSGQTQQDPGRLVRVFRAKTTTHRLAITSYGTSRASEVWTAIAEVSGRANDVSSRFEPGEILPADLLLVEIDPTDYQLAVKRLGAEVRAKNERLHELDQTQRNLTTIYQLQQRQLKLAADEYQRQREVFARHAGSRSAMEVAENGYVSALTELQKTRNSLALIPVQRELAQAALDVSSAELEQANRELSKCEIRLPMPARCATKSVEDNQYVTSGERLGTFLALDSAEVVAKVETRKMLSLFPDGIEELGTLDLTAMDHAESIWKRFDVPAEVHWALGDSSAVWYGRVSRIGPSLDPATRTIQVMVEVAHPYKNVRPGVRPPLIPDAFCEVTLYGETLDGVVVIPRDALRDGRVYLLRDGKLHIRPVNVVALEKDTAVICEGIKSGDEVILTDLFPASEGMPLRGQVVPNPARSRPAVNFPKGRPTNNLPVCKGDSPIFPAKKSGQSPASTEVVP